MLQIKKFIFSPFSENTYLLWDDNTGEGALVDPGCFDPFEEKELSEFIAENKISLKYCINTHCHIDHIFGCSFIKENFPVTFIAPKEDVPLLQNAERQAEMFGIEIRKPPQPDKYLNENEDIKIGEWVMKPLFTPGHTPGEYCLYFPAAGVCITGDVLFKDSIGRTDLWGGNLKVLMESIKTKLLTLPDETVIYPGHGEESTIGKEKHNNPFLH